MKLYVYEYIYEFMLKILLLKYYFTWNSCSMAKAPNATSYQRHPRASLLQCALKHSSKSKRSASAVHDPLQWAPCHVGVALRSPIGGASGRGSGGEDRKRRQSVPSGAISSCRGKTQRGAAARADWLTNIRKWKELGIISVQLLP